MPAGSVAQATDPAGVPFYSIGRDDIVVLRYCLAILGYGRYLDGVAGRSDNDVHKVFTPVV